MHREDGLLPDVLFSTKSSYNIRDNGKGASEGPWLHQPNLAAVLNTLQEL